MIALPLCVRRRFPLTALVAVSVLFFLAGERVPMAFGSNIVIQASLFVAMYAATAWARDRRRLKVTMIVVVVGMFVWLVYGFVKALREDTIQGHNEALLSPYVSYVLLNIGINIAYFFGAIFWGRTAWRTARQHDELQRQAAELAAQQQANARRAVIDERLRISRELHDVVAHHISSIGVQAGGARRVMEHDPEAAKGALSVIEESSRTAVNEMRQLHAARGRPGPGRGGRRRHAEGAAGGGGPAARARGGRQRGPAVRRLPLDRPAGAAAGDRLGVDLPDRSGGADERPAALHRRSAHVTLRYIEDGAVEVEVIDDGRPKHAPVGSRLGHVGIRERVALLGGQSEIGPRPVGGFRVRARIPVKEQE